MGSEIIKDKLNKKINTLLIILFILIISFFPAIQSLELQYNLNLGLETKDRIPILKQMGPVGTYKDYINKRENKTYFIQKISESLVKTDSPLVIIFVEADLVSDLTDELILYNETLKIVGYGSVVYQVSGIITNDLKDIIITYWQSGYNVTGTVLIGDLPVEWFHHENDFSGPSEFPCDLFLMDLDGTWIDTDSDGMYDSHIDGLGDTAPEIFAGRIDASNVPGEEITILKKYFAKINDFWSGNTNQTEFGLTYTDKDWADYSSFRYDLGYGYEEFEAIWYPDVNRNDYVNNRIPGTYEFIQLSCHSSSQGHAFTLGGWASSNDIRNAPPQALFYNLFCCSSLRFTDYNCIGYAYILNTDTPSLTVIGSAKTGSMLDFRYFYEPIGNGSSFGTAFRKWFEYEYPYDDDPNGYNDISWFYGMTILGDPTIIIKNMPPYGTNITGPEIGYTYIEYDFYIKVFDPNNDKIYCIFDWGDGTNSGWLGPYDSGETIFSSHIWEEPGEYLIRFKLKDTRGYESIWSNPTVITIIENKPPEKPTISGPTTGVLNKLIKFTFKSIDPEGHDLYYMVNWGDGHYIPYQGPYNSGEEVIFSHAWGDEGEYTIIAKAKDQFGVKSPQSSIKLSITKKRTLTNPIILGIQKYLLDYIPNLLSLLQRLLQRLEL